MHRESSVTCPLLLTTRHVGRNDGPWSERRPVRESSGFSPKENVVETGTRGRRPVAGSSSRGSKMYTLSPGSVSRHEHSGCLQISEHSFWLLVETPSPRHGLHGPYGFCTALLSKKLRRHAVFSVKRTVTPVSVIPVCL